MASARTRSSYQAQNARHDSTRNYQRPIPQPVPTPNFQIPTTFNQLPRDWALGLENWEWLEVGRWALGVLAASLQARLPTDAGKISHARHADLEPFGAQELTFQLQVATITAEAAAGGDDAMAWRGGIAGLAHDGADRTPGAGRAGKFGDIAIRGDMSGWNATHRGEHAVLEG